MPIDSVAALTIGLVDEVDIVRFGLHQLARRLSNLTVLDLSRGSRPTTPVDVALFDPFTPAGFEATTMRSLRGQPSIRRVAVYTWQDDEAHVPGAMAVRADGFLSKRLTVDQLVGALYRIKAGERVAASPHVGLPERPEAPLLASLPAGIRGEELTAREVDVLRLIAQGLGNADIAQHLFLSVNSIKSYIRSAYRKLGVKSRSQAVLWALENGLYEPAEAGRHPLGAA